MTQSLAPVNAGVVYATGNVLPAASANAWTANEQLNFALQLHHQSPVVTPDALGTSAMAVWAGTGLAVAALGDASPYVYFGLEIDPTGATHYTAITGLPNGTTLCVGRNAGASTFDAIPRTMSTSLYVTTGNSIAAWAAPVTLGTGISAQDYYALSSTVRFFVGNDGAGASRIIEISGSTVVRNATNANTANLTAIAGNGAASLVAVGIGGASWTANSGATWTHVVLTPPTGAVGAPCIAWDASRSLYVVSLLLSTGVLAWSTSSTGATWSAWSTFTVGMSVAVLAGVTTPSCGIAVMGTTWVAPYVSGTVANNHAGLLVSIDAGASWRAIPGGEQMLNYNSLRVVPCDDRVALVSRGGVVMCGGVVGYDMTNSVVV